MKKYVQYCTITAHICGRGEEVPREAGRCARRRVERSRDQFRRPLIHWENALLGLPASSLCVTPGYLDRLLPRKLRQDFYFARNNLPHFPQIWMLGSYQIGRKE